MHHEQRRPTRRFTMAALGVGIALVALVGCAGGPHARAADPDITTGSAPESATASPSASTGAGGAATRSTAPTSSPLARCDVGQLSGSTTKDVHTDVDIDIPVTLTNTGSVGCTIQGWPGVSFATGQEGTQVGPGAELDRASSHPTVTLQPGGQAHFVLEVHRPDDDANAFCAPRVTDGLRVIPPGSTESVFVEAPGYDACSQGVNTLMVTAVTAGPAT